MMDVAGRDQLQQLWPRLRMQADILVRLFRLQLGKLNEAPHGLHRAVAGRVVAEVKPAVKPAIAGADRNIGLQLHGILAKVDLVLLLADGQIHAGADHALCRNGQMQALDGGLSSK